MLQTHAHFRLLLATALSATFASGLRAESVVLIPTPGQVIAVELITQHIVVGIVDQRTDQQSLWLRRTISGVQLISGYTWDRVVRWNSSDSEPSEFEVVSHEAIIGESAQSRLVATIHQRPKVVAIEVFAEVANWDGDVEPDGLRVFLRPIDAFGHTVPVRGQVSFTLLGQRPPWRGNTHLRPRERFGQFGQGKLGQWSRRVKPEHVSPRGSIYQLEFRRFHPDRNFDVATEAILHARLGVPSVGVFEVSSPPVLLRSFSWLRDDLQHFTGRRFFAAEHAGSITRP